MTLIVGIETDRGAWIGADSWVGGGDDGTTDRVDGAKVHRIGLAVVGMAGYLPAMQWLVDHLDLGERPMRTPVDRWLRDRFRAAMRGAPKDDDGVDAIVILDGEVWTIDSDFAVLHSILGYAAIGVAQDGAMHALCATDGMPPRKRLARVLKAAALHSDRVAPPWAIQFVEQAAT